MWAPGLVGPRRARRPLGAYGAALAVTVAVVGLALGSLGWRMSFAPLRMVVAAAVSLPLSSHQRIATSSTTTTTATTTATAATIRDRPSQWPSSPCPRNALRPLRGGIQPPFSIRPAPSAAQGLGSDSEAAPVPGSAWLLEPVAIAILASEAVVQLTPPCVAVVALAVACLGLWRLATLAPRLWGMGVPDQWDNSRHPTQSPSRLVWYVLATAASPQGPAGPEASLLPPPSFVDVGGAEYHAPLSPELQQHLEGFSIDVRKVVRRCPAVVNYDVGRVERATSYLAGLKVDVRRVVEAYPALLTGKAERYEAVVELLRANGVNVPKAVNRNPSILRRRLDPLRHTMAAIAACGHSVADVVDRWPFIFRCTPADVAAMLQLHRRSEASATQERPASGQPPPSLAGALGAADPRVALLASLGLDTDRLLRKAPFVLACSLDKLQVSVAYLKGLGVDTPRVVWRAPTVLNFVPETLQRRVQFLAENGLDVVRHINGCPNVLLYSVERKLQPTLTFVVEEMKRSTVELNAASNLWSYSLEDRLRPRFQYLQSLGLLRPPLASFGIYPDAQFASRLAGTDLQHYYAWRLRNGYAVPSLPTDADPTGPEEKLAHSPSVGTAVSPALPPSETEAPSAVQP